MAPKKMDHMGDMSGMPKYQFHKETDAKVRGQMAPQLGADPGGGVVREGTFRARRDAQIKRRKAKGY